MNSTDFHTPQREDLFATLFSAAKVLRILFNILWPLGLASLLKGELFFFPLYVWAIILVVVCLLIGLHSYLAWKNFNFYIKDNEFVVKKGYLRKSIVTLPLEKIVSVNTHQKLLHQVLGVVAVQVDSTGTSKKEVEIKALKKKYAIALEKALDTANAKAVESDSQETEQKQPKELLKLSVWQLFKVGIARNHIQGLLLLLLFINQIRYDLQDFFKKEVDDVFDKTTDYFLHSDILAWGVAIGFVIILAFFISVIRTFLSYFDLQLVLEKASFRLQHGLLKRKKILVPFSRVQAVETSSNPLQRWLKINTIRIIQANVKTSEKDSEKILLPGASKQQIAKLTQTIFQKTLHKKVVLKPHWTYRNRLFYLNILPLVIILPFTYFSWWVLLAIPVFLIVGIVSAYVGYRRCQYILDDELLHTISGVFVQSETRIMHYKIQGVRISQNIFQRKRKTASLSIELAGTDLDIINLPVITARQLKDFLLHKVITSSKDWL